MIAIAIILMYIPILIALIYSARGLKRKLNVGGDKPPISPRMAKIARAFGTVAATAFTLVSVYLVPGGNRWDAAPYQISVFLIAPFVLGHLFVLLGRYWHKIWGGERGSIVMNHLGIGAFNSVWFIPLFLLTMLFLRVIFY